MPLRDTRAVFGRIYVVMANNLGEAETIHEALAKGRRCQRRTSGRTLRVIKSKRL